MSTEPSPEQLSTLPKLSAEERYDYLVETLLASCQVWTLRGDDGTALMSSDGDDCLPIWPHAELAAAWAVGDWADCAPFAIDLDAWVERWLPGMQADGLALAVFPGAEEEGLVIEPVELHERLLAGQS